MARVMPAAADCAVMMMVLAWLETWNEWQVTCVRENTV